jgi:hypothetical protein
MNYVEFLQYASVSNFLVIPGFKKQLLHCVLIL